MYKRHQTKGNRFPQWKHESLALLFQRLYVWFCVSFTEVVVYSGNEEQTAFIFFQYAMNTFTSPT